MYKHVQHSPLHWLLYLLSAFLFFFVWQAQRNTAPALMIGVAAVVLLAFSLAFRTLTVSDRGEYLRIRYGPLNLFGTKIAYRDITAVEQGKTSVIDGWGIHFIPLRGWTFNLWGFDCAIIRRGDKVTRIGTDDAENLVKFLRARLTENSTSDY